MTAIGHSQFPIHLNKNSVALLSSQNFLTFNHNMWSESIVDNSSTEYDMVNKKGDKAKVGILEYHEKSRRFKTSHRLDYMITLFS